MIARQDVQARAAILDRHSKLSSHIYRLARTMPAFYIKKLTPLILFASYQ